MNIDARAGVGSPIPPPKRPRSAPPRLRPRPAPPPRPGPVPVPPRPPAPAAHSVLLQDWLLLRSSSCCKTPVLLQYFLLLHRILNPPTRAAAAFACKNVLYSPSPPVPPLPHTFKPCRWSSTSRRGDPALRPAREPASARTPCLGRATCRRFADSFRADDDHSGNTGSPAFMTTPNLARHDIRAGAICLQAPLR